MLDHKDTCGPLVKEFGLHTENNRELVKCFKDGIDGETGEVTCLGSLSCKAGTKRQASGFPTQWFEQTTLLPLMSKWKSVVRELFSPKI